MEPVTILAVVATVVSVGTAIYASTLSTGSDQEDVGASVTKTGVTATKNPVYGKCRVSSVNVYNNVKDSSNEWLLSVFSYGIGPLNGVHQIYIDEIPTLNIDTVVTIPNGDITQNRFNAVGDFTNQDVQIQIRSGIETELACSMAIENSDGEWTTAHRGDRCGSVAILAKRNIKDEGARILAPQYSVSALVSGLSVYDPRAGSDPNVKVFSRNPALAILDYITNDYYGMGIDYKYIDLTSFINSANHCENQFTIDAEIDSSQAFSKILGNMLACFGGILVAEDGYVKLKFDAISPIMHEFDENDIVGSGIRVTNQSTSGYYNVIETKFKSSLMDEKEDVYTLPANVNTDPRIASDGYTKSKTLELPYVLDNGNGPVKILTNREFRRSNYQKQVDFDLDLTENKVFLYDVIAISNEHYGWVSKPWRITAINKTIDEEKLNVATISCMEYSDSIYTGEDDGNIGNPVKPLPPLTEPTNLEFNQTTYITAGYGELTWNNTSFSTGSISQVEYKLASDAGWTRLGETKEELFKVQNLNSGDYNFRVRNYHQIRGASPWSAILDVTIAPNVILPEVTGATVNTTTQDFIFGWNDMLNEPVGNPVDGPDNDGTDGTVKSWFSHYQVDIFHREGDDWIYKKSYYPTSNNLTYLYADNVANSINRQIRADIYIVAKDTTKSPQGSGSTVNGLNPQHGIVTGYDASSELGVVNLLWSKSTEFDFYGTQIHLSKDINFVPDGSTLIANTVASFYTFILPEDSVDGELYYLRLGSYDVFGTDNINFTPAILVRYNSIESLLPDIGADLKVLRSPFDDNGDRIQNPDLTLKSVDNNTVTAIGLKSDEATSRSDVIIAADRLMLSAGGHPTWVDDEAYLVGDRVIFNNIDPDAESTYLGELTVGGSSDETDSNFGFITYQNVRYGNLEPLTCLGAVVVGLSSNGNTFTLEFDKAPNINGQTITIVFGSNSIPLNSTADDKVFTATYTTDNFSNYAAQKLNVGISVPPPSGQRPDVTGINMLFECIVANTNQSPNKDGTDNTYWKVINKNIDRAAFYFDADGRMYLENATIENLSGDKITVDTLQGNRIIGQSIEGDKISATTTITAGVVPPPQEEITYITPSTFIKVATITYVGDVRYGWNSLPGDQNQGEAVGLKMHDYGPGVDLTMIYTSSSQNRTIIEFDGFSYGLRSTPSEITVEYNNISYTFQREGDIRFFYPAQLWGANELGDILDIKITSERFTQPMVTSELVVGNVSGEYGFRLSTGMGSLTNPAFETGNNVTVISQINASTAEISLSNTISQDIIGVYINDIQYMFNAITSPNSATFTTTESIFDAGDVGTTVTVKFIERYEEKFQKNLLESQINIQSGTSGMPTAGNPAELNGYRYNSVGSMTNTGVFGASIVEFGRVESYSRTNLIFDSIPDIGRVIIPMIIDGVTYHFRPDPDPDREFIWFLPYAIYQDSTVGSDSVLKIVDREVATSVAGISGIDDGSNVGLDNVRIWAGATLDNARNAPFVVFSDGTMNASNANITGTINASSGNFAGNVNGAVISGSVLKGNNIESTTIQSATIYSATIYTSETFINSLGDNSTTRNYPFDTNIPVACNQNIINGMSYSVPTNDSNYRTSALLYSAGDISRSQVLTNRAAFRTIPEDAIMIRIVTHERQGNNFSGFRIGLVNTYGYAFAESVEFSNANNTPPIGTNFTVGDMTWYIKSGSFFSGGTKNLDIVVANRKTFYGGGWESNPNIAFLPAARQTSAHDGPATIYFDVNLNNTIDPR